VTTNTTTYQPSMGTEPANGTGPVDGAASITPPDDSLPTRPLGDFLPGGPAAPQLAVTLPDGAAVVVLRRAGDGQVEVWGSGRTSCWDAATPASAVTDSARRAGLLHAAVHGLAEQRHTMAEQARRARQDRDQDRAEHDRVLNAIRAYAVEHHQDGDICRTGLNDFLTHFGLPVYEPRVRVHYSISGSYEVEGEDPDAARRDARSYLKPDLSQLDNVIDDSDTYTVHVDRVEELDT
jgi:hypothetical protein